MVCLTCLTVLLCKVSQQQNSLLLLTACRRDSLMSALCISKFRSVVQRYRVSIFGVARESPPLASPNAFEKKTMKTFE